MTEQSRPAESGCSTIVVGRLLSKSGRVLIGHNEDNGGPVVTSQYWVPPQTWTPGAKMRFEPDSAELARAPRTLGFWWCQTLVPGGTSWSDLFLNEAGVAVVSNSCNDTFEKDEPVIEGGVGYAVRRLAAERARSAREAMEIAVRLAAAYGYRDQGRTYTFADSREAWQVFLLHGRRWCARRVQDDEVVYTSNAFSLESLDGVPPEDVRCSPDLLEHIPAGAPEGEESRPFSFRRRYQPARRREAAWNFRRSARALEVLGGIRCETPDDVPYAFRPIKRLTPEDLMHALADHDDAADEAEKPARGRPAAPPPAHRHESMRDICNLGTFASVVFELHAEPLRTRGWFAPGRPCTVPYIPFRPLAGPSPASAFMTPDEALAVQFNPPAEIFSRAAKWTALRSTAWAFLDAQDAAEWSGSPAVARAKRLAEVRGGELEAPFAGRIIAPIDALKRLNAMAWADAAARMTAAAREAAPVHTLYAAFVNDRLVLHAQLPGVDPAAIDPASVEAGVPWPTPDVDPQPRVRCEKLSALAPEGAGRAANATAGQTHGDHKGAFECVFPAEAFLRALPPGPQACWMHLQANGRTYAGRFFVERPAEAAEDEAL